MKYQPVKGSRLTPEQAQRYGDFIRAQELTRPEELVDAARPADSPLHDAFEWDDSAAAEAYRKAQAAYVLRSIEVIITEAAQPVRAFHPVIVRGDDKRQYLSVDVIRGDADFLAQVVQAAAKELRAWQRKYQQYTTLSTALATVDAAIEAALEE